jgi:signal transduction histidine kinase
MRAQELLSNIRAQILLGSVYVRDALLDSNPETGDSYRRQLASTYQVVDTALDQYVPVLEDGDERQRIARLRREIGAFRYTMDQAMASGPDRTPTEIRLLLQESIVPKRELIIGVSEDVQALNRSAFVRRQSAIAEIHRSAQTRVWQQLGLALTTGLGIALFATLYSSRLEGRIRLQGAQEAHNREELERLSVKLVRAQEEERRTIARELHDEVGQVLTAIKVELALAQRTINSAGGSAEVLGEARTMTDGALQTVRDLSHLLHPALLDDLGLPAAIDWYLRGFRRRHGIRVELLNIGFEERLPPETETAAYRIIQEALTNVARHARATACTVHLQRLATTVLIAVEDDGVGFDLAGANSAAGRPSLGLINVRERAAAIGGAVQIRSEPGRGTRLTAELPAEARPISLSSESRADRKATGPLGHVTQKVTGG